MKKIMIIISIVVLISIIYSANSFAYYRDQNWECTRAGETSPGDFYGRYSSSFNNGVCQKSCCILCTSKSPIKDCFGGSAKPMCSCSQGTSTDTTVPELLVNSPLNDNIYNKRAVDFNLVSNERVKIEYIDNQDTRKGYRLLCKGCTSFNRKLNFKEGINDITIKATDSGGNIKESLIKFRIDSKAPQISKTEPKNGAYGNGQFTIDYTEDNLESVTLFYRLGLLTQTNAMTTNTCESGIKKSCTLNVNGLQDGEVYYSFELEDIANVKKSSKETKIIIDTTAPVLTLSPDLTSGVKDYNKKLPLSLSVSEKIDLSYKDLNGNNKFNILCKNCNAYTKPVTFRQGSHNIIVRATDRAGNTDEESLVFNIV